MVAKQKSSISEGHLAGSKYSQHLGIPLKIKYRLVLPAAPSSLTPLTDDVVHCEGDDGPWTLFRLFE